MRGAVISYIEMCQREGISLQRGMNFRTDGRPSVVLMPVPKGAPYKDHVEEDGAVLIYEGHDVPRSTANPIPKSVDQPMYTPAGKLTENGKFWKAAQAAQSGAAALINVQVYEKIRPGIWTDNGLFELAGAHHETYDDRNVFKFRLVAVDDAESQLMETSLPIEREINRIIPSVVKREVWERDGGKCVECGANDDLHFDHIIPYSKGGSSLTAANIQLLCARHNLEKSDHLQ